jgi:dTDP-4-dehydrorhamnose reductase
MDATGMAQATMSLLLKGANGLLNVAARQATTKKRFVETVALHLGKSLTRSQSASVLVLKPKRADSLGLDVRQAEAVLGISLPTLDEVAASLVREYHEQCSIKHRF